MTFAILQTLSFILNIVWWIFLIMIIMSWLISFNGELYNFQELRPALAAAGVSLRGRTDTEVLIESVALWGAEALPKFDGVGTRPWPK